MEPKVKEKNEKFENIDNLKRQVDGCTNELSRRFEENPDSEISEEYDLHYLLADKFLEKGIHESWKVRWEYNPSHNRKKQPGMLDLAILDSQYKKDDEILIGVEVKFFPSVYLIPLTRGDLAAITKDLNKLRVMKKDKKLRYGYLLVFARKGLYEKRSSEGRTKKKEKKYLEKIHRLESHIADIKNELPPAGISVELILDNKISSDRRRIGKRDYVNIQRSYGK